MLKVRRGTAEEPTAPGAAAQGQGLVAGPGLGFATGPEGATSYTWAAILALIAAALFGALILLQFRELSSYRSAFPRVGGGVAAPVQ